MDDEYQIGKCACKPYYVIGEDGTVIKVNLPADAAVEESKPGHKAGNPLLDEINESLRQGGLIEKMKELYRKGKD